MHMSWWFGYDLGEFLFSGLEISSRWSFAITWIILFFFAILFEASKVYLAGVQREALKKLYPHRSDERRNLLCDREQGSMEPTTSRNANAGQFISLKFRLLVNLYQSFVFVMHNVAGYLLMLAVMVYNAQLLIAVVLGMMLGYFLFGPKLTRLQMQCFNTKRTIVCTPECDDTAESTTPPLLDSSNESDFFICQTRTCIQPSHYFRAGTSQDGATANTCYYGAKQCPSKVAKARRIQAESSQCHHTGKEGSPVEDSHLLTKQGCCEKSQQNRIEEDKKCCGKKSSQIETISAVVHEPNIEISNSEELNENVDIEQNREHSPQIMCCHKAKSASTESQEQIMK